MNGTTTTAAITAEHTALAQWQDTIATLDAAILDSATARAAIEELSVTLERLEAGHVLAIDGGNAEQRKARLTLALADDARYQVQVSALRQARANLADADRRMQVSKERCRLLRTALAPAE